jgi:hypothetical protein
MLHLSMSVGTLLRAIGALHLRTGRTGLQEISVSKFWRVELQETEML